MKRIVSAAVVAALTLVGAATQAQAAPLSCGDTVTTDVVLTQNLTCAGTALKVSFAAPGSIHIDLNGHKLLGNGTGTGIDTTASPAAGDLTVSGGLIRGFAVAVVGSKQPSIRNLTLDGMTLRSNGAWLTTGVFDDIDVLGTTVVDSGTGGGYPEASLTSRSSTFVNSSIASASETYNYLYDSTFVGGGFSHGYSANVVAVGNSFKNCSVGISVPDVWNGSPTTIENNTFSNCTRGVQLSATGGTATIRNNVFRGNATGGLSFQVGRFITLDVSGNLATSNGGDGIQGTGSTLVTVGGNRSIGNAGKGIDVSGVTDGGGNVARNNATQPQCIGVVCTLR